MLNFIAEIHGFKRSTTIKLICNKASYIAMRAIHRPPNLGWHESPWHWYRFPFSLRGKVLWSRPLGAWFCPGNEAAMELMLHEASYEPVEWVAPDRGDILLDIGAFVGWHTIRAARMVGSAGRIISLEPDSLNRKQLEHNLELNRIVNCTVLPLAAWSKTGAELGWYVEKSPDCCRVDENKSGAVIRTITIDDLVREMQLTRLNWIKMDIEGGEVEALKGAEKTLYELRPRLFVEVHNTTQFVKQFLGHCGYWIEREAYDQSPEPHGWFQARFQ